MKSRKGKLFYREATSLMNEAKRLLIIKKSAWDIRIHRAGLSSPSLNGLYFRTWVAGNVRRSFILRRINFCSSKKRAAGGGIPNIIRYHLIKISAPTSRSERKPWCWIYIAEYFSVPSSRREVKASYQSTWEINEKFSFSETKYQIAARGKFLLQSNRTIRWKRFELES